MKKNNLLINVLINIIIPLVILTKLSKEEYFGPIWGLLIALAFPLLFGLYELIIQKQKSFTAIIGFIGVMLTGVIGLLKFPPHWIAIKEATIPLLIGFIVLLSTKKSWQIITKFLYNREFLDIDKIEDRLRANGLQILLNRKLNKANLFLSCSFFFSAVLNYCLAKIIVRSMPGTSQFNEEIGQMTMLSFLVIALPSVVIMVFILKYVMSSIKSLTQLSSSEVLSEKFRAKT